MQSQSEILAVWTSTYECGEGHSSAHNTRVPCSTRGTKGVDQKPTGMASRWLAVGTLSAVGLCGPRRGPSPAMWGSKPKGGTQTSRTRTPGDCLQPEAASPLLIHSTNTELGARVPSPLGSGPTSLTCALNPLLGVLPASSLALATPFHFLLQKCRSPPVSPHLKAAGAPRCFVPYKIARVGALLPDPRDLLQPHQTPASPCKSRDASPLGPRPTP